MLDLRGSSLRSDKCELDVYLSGEMTAPQRTGIRSHPSPESPEGLVQGLGQGQLLLTGQGTEPTCPS